ncbi:MAG: SEC-C domain-containing protein [Planctomycetes bacterium]|nr:SEC-C domain-containing protein [Planctomycetota bacterium]
MRAPDGKQCRRVATKILPGEFGDVVFVCEQSHYAPDRSEKVGRNYPCPCGSGRKYKKCCGGGA